MVRIGLIREEKNPPDTRVAFSPEQCVHIMQEYPEVHIVVEPSPNRCFEDAAYEAAGITLSTDLTDRDILIGIKEVPVDKLMEGKTYLFFSHTKKKQLYNQKLMKALIAKRIRMIDYECLTHADGQRILGFGYFAGVVGAHNGLLTYGRKWGKFKLRAAHECADFEEMIAQYQDIMLPPVKIAVTGSGKVAAGILEIMHRFDIEYVEPEDYLEKTFEYPVYTHLKGHTLYVRKDNGTYHRDDFHRYPQDYQCVFKRYLPVTDILMNGIYWDQKIPRLFEKEDVKEADYKMLVIADITCDIDGSVSINNGASTIAEPVYGIRRDTLDRTMPFLHTADVVDVMAVDNLPNELARDASSHFGQHLGKFVLSELLKGGESDIIARATLCANGDLTPYYEYLRDYAFGQ
jgi:saccharopine dehydrogenase (NAD+, L-lysine-forming)